VSASRQALAVVLLAVAGLAAAVALAVALSQATGHQVGLSAQPLDAGNRLVAPVRRIDTAPDRPPRPHRRPAGGSAPAPPAPAPAHDDSGGGDDGAGPAANGGDD
jgi:hypothetical protein